MSEVRVVGAESPVPDGNARKVYANLRFFDTYLAGGLPVEAKDFGLSEILEMHPMSGTTAGYVIGYNRATGKVRMFGGAAAPMGPAQAVAAGTTIDGETARVCVRGY